MFQIFGNLDIKMFQQLSLKHGHSVHTSRIKTIIWIKKKSIVHNYNSISWYKNREIHLARWENRFRKPSHKVTSRINLFKTIIWMKKNSTISKKPLCHCHYATVHCSYISFSVLFQIKSSLVWKSYTKKLRTIFQTNSTLVWKKIDFASRRIQTNFGLVWKK